MREFIHTFEELPLLIENGFHAGLVNGSATIRYTSEAEWFVSALTLDGHKARPDGGYDRKPVTIERGEYPWLYGAIFDQLETGVHKSFIEDKIEAELAEEGIGRPPDWKEHGTINKVMQGI